MLSKSDTIKLIQLNYWFANPQARRKKEEFLDEAQSGNPISQLNLGIILLSSKPKEAFKWVEQAAEQDLPPALSFLGSLYLSGIGVKKNLQKVKEIIERLEAIDPLLEQFLTALLHLMGNSPEYNSNEAFDLHAQISQSLEPGGKYAQRPNAKILLAVAQTNIAFCYYRGVGCQRDFQRARVLLDNAAEIGLPAALFSSGAFQFAGVGGKRNYRQSLEKLLPLANQGVSRAALYCGLIYSLRLRWIKSLYYLWRGGFRGKFFIFAYAFLLIYLGFYLWYSLAYTIQNQNPERDIQAVDSLLKGKPLNFSGEFFDGGSYRAEEFRGKTVLLSFDRLDSPYLKKRVALEKRLYDKFHPEGLEIIEIIYGKDFDFWEKYIQDYEIPWKIIPDFSTQIQGVNLGEYCRIKTVPTFVLLNSSGIVVEIGKGNRNWEALIEYNINNPPVTSDDTEE